MTAAYDIAVFGAGVFGAWTAYHLSRAGHSVLLLDPYGPGNSRSSSGGESRVIRMGYGRDDLYTRFAMQSLNIWPTLPSADGEPLLYRTGVLWLGHEHDEHVGPAADVLKRLGVNYERLTVEELRRRYPQIATDGVADTICEPESGVLMARRAVRTVVREAIRFGAIYETDAVEGPGSDGSIRTHAGRTVRADHVVYACGPWLPKIFPELLASRIRVTRQEVFFFGAPPGDDRFAPPAMPAWIDFTEEVYGVPDLEHRGFKIAFDRHGEEFDPDLINRVVSETSVAAVRRVLARRFPALSAAPLLEMRVCQYENTSNGDFLIDRHPDHPHVWLVGGGSGHGFKHGPAVGQYVADRICGAVSEEPRFGLQSKDTRSARQVY